MRRAVTRTAVTLVLAMGIYAGAAVGVSQARPPQCSTYPCTTTKTPVAVKLGKRKLDTTMSAQRGATCYYEQAWESWDTRSGKISFFNQVHWCGIPYVRVYLNQTTGRAAHRLVLFWSSKDPSWSDAFQGNHRTIRTVAHEDWHLDDPTQSIVLQEIQPQLCLNVYANGYARISCHD